MLGFFVSCNFPGPSVPTTPLPVTWGSTAQECRTGRTARQANRPQLCCNPEKRRWEWWTRRCRLKYLSKVRLVTMLVLIYESNQQAGVLICILHPMSNALNCRYDLFFSPCQIANKSCELHVYAGTMLYGVFLLSWCEHHKPSRRKGDMGGRLGGKGC